MYFPVGWPKIFRVQKETDEPLLHVVSNRDRSLFAILSSGSVHIWFCKPSVQICAYRRSGNSLRDHGANVTAEWNSDATSLAVVTDKGFFIFYKIASFAGNQSDSLYTQKSLRKPAVRDSSGSSSSSSNLLGGRIPPLTITEVCCRHVSSSITSVTHFRDELVVSTTESQLLRLRWDGNFNRDYGADLKKVPFSSDLQRSSRPGFLDQSSDVHAVQVEYSPLMTGFGVVLSDGRGAFLTATSTKYEPSSIQGVWAPEIKAARCVFMSNKYRLIVFGCDSGAGMAFSIDTSTGSLQLSHRLLVASKDYPDARQTTTGALMLVKATPDECAIIGAWEKGGIALWSVFGSLLFCSLQSPLEPDHRLGEGLCVKSMVWGADGYHLWIIKNWAVVQSSRAGSPSESSPLPPAIDKSDFMQLQFAKAAIAANPCTSNHQHMYLHSEDRLYLTAAAGAVDSPPSGVKPAVHGSTQGGHYPSAGSGGGGEQGGSKHWDVVLIQSTYLTSNWPIKFTAIDDSGTCVAVAGRLGLAHYSLLSRRWKIFGNESQEKEVAVCGGLSWWQEFVCAGCYNFAQQRDEIRLYPQSQKLDNAFCISTKVPFQILLINVVRDHVVCLCTDSHVMIFALASIPAAAGQAGRVSVTYVQEVNIESWIPHPLCVSALTLTTMRTEMASGSGMQAMERQSPAGATEPESILLNVAGKVLVLQRDRSGPQPKELADHQRLLPFSNPFVVASCVENAWTTVSVIAAPAAASAAATAAFAGDAGVSPSLVAPFSRAPVPPRLTAATASGGSSSSSSAVTAESGEDALWLNCGAQGMKVWLPLPPPAKDASMVPPPRHGFMSKRIMLPFAADACPLAVLFEEGVVLGAAADTVAADPAAFSCSSAPATPSSPAAPSSLSSTSTSTIGECAPYAVIEKTSHIYLHHVLRQLLRRNLGYHALGFARGFTGLPYFTHILELLLHEVLEEEATSREPLPDPLLPRVVEFCREFPQYRQVIVHCARKTEVALWDHLFSTVGSPKLLFEECLADRDLDTAASYLIILQSLEKPFISRQHATLLLEAALEKQYFGLARDLVRFLSAIDPSEADADPTMRVATAGIRYGNRFTPPPLAPEDQTDAFALNKMPLARNLSLGHSENQKKAVAAERSEKAQQAAAATPDSTAFRKETSTSAYRRRHSSSSNSNRDDEQHAVSNLLNRHARKLLAAYRLRDLGIFAANLEEYELVSWLRRERQRTAKVDNFVQALKQLLHDFQWPLPILTHSAFYQMSLPHSAAASARPAEEIPFSRNKSSGSVHEMDLGMGAEESASVHSENVILVARSRNQAAASTPEPSEGAGTEVSESGCDGSATFGRSDDLEFLPSADLASAGQGTPASADINQLTLSLACQGSKQSELELRYLYQITSEAGCVEWCVLIAVILRDVHAFTRAVNLACLPEAGTDAVRRLRGGMAALARWSDGECLGYRPFLHSVRTDLEVLDSLSRLSSATTPTSASDGRQLLAVAGVNAAPEAPPEGASSENRVAAVASAQAAAGTPFPLDRRTDDSSTDSGSGSSSDSSGCLLQ